MVSLNVKYGGGGVNRLDLFYVLNINEMSTEENGFQFWPLK